LFLQELAETQKIIDSHESRCATFLAAAFYRVARLHSPLEDGLRQGKLFCSMSYQVIARKYRPQCFPEVVGQEHVTQTLSNAISQNRIAHAYLFVGPRGTGKTTIARIFAKCLNCTGGPNANFAEDDPKCREIAEGRSMDVLEIDGASNRGIDEIRELRDTVKYVPTSSKFKIYIIDEVHMLTKEAFNALLKTLEEPPEHVKFMFATTEPEKILPTILSRCQRFDLRRIPATLIVKHLSEIAASEKVKIDEAALYAIARGAEGGMRDAESTLDQLISFCGESIQESDVLSMFGLTARAQIMALGSAIIHGNSDATLREFNDLAANGKDLARLVADLLGHFRNILIYQVSKGDLSLLEISEREATAIAEQAKNLRADTLTRIMEVLTDTESRLRETASKKILIEIGLLKAIEARNAMSIDAVLSKLQDLRNGSGAVEAPARTQTAPRSTAGSAPTSERVMSEPSRISTVAEDISARTAAPAPVTTEIQPSLQNEAATPAVSSSERTDLEALWSQIVDAAGRASPFIRSYLLEAHPVSISKNIFTIGFDPEFKDHLSLVDNSKNRTVIETKLRELGYRDLQVKFIEAAAPLNRAPVQAQPESALLEEPANPSASSQMQRPPSAGGSTPARSGNKEDFKNDPLIKKALEIFKGQIVEVRG
jgi:DNA polymerase-3 subunit gamma/tau